MEQRILINTPEMRAWLDENGILKLKVADQSIYTAELTENETRTLAAILLRYANGELE